SLFLALYRRVFADFAYLPSVQLALYVGAVLLLAIAAARRTGSLALAAGLLGLALGVTDATNFPYVLSDTIYAAALIAGVACFLLYAETCRAAFLLLAGSAIGAAIAFRSIGLALLPGFVIAVWAAARLCRRRLIQTAVLAM